MWEILSTLTMNESEESNSTVHGYQIKSQDTNLGLYHVEDKLFSET